MTRMIERWFPCAEVSEASQIGWGSGNSEANMFTWFAKRPIAQAKAAVLTSLLPWPDDEAEQRRLRELVQRAMKGRDGAWNEVVAEIERHHPDGVSMLDPFSGRAMIPLEAARLGVQANGIDYSPVATLAGQLLADFPMRDWSDEPVLPFSDDALDVNNARLVADVRAVLGEIGRRSASSLADVYPEVNGLKPWGYLWAVTLPCQECGLRFPLVGSLTLRLPQVTKHDRGQSYEIVVDRPAGTFRAEVRTGQATTQPSLVASQKNGKPVPGKSAICPFCEHLHPVALHRRLMNEGFGEDCLLVVGDVGDSVGKVFRSPTVEEIKAVQRAEERLSTELPFAEGLPAIPDERIPVGNTSVVQPSAYGYATYGELCNKRQTLSLISLAREIDTLGAELVKKHGVSDDYARALVGYASSVLVRKLRRSTRGARLQTTGGTRIGDIFVNETSIGFAYDYFEAGPYMGPGTWDSVTKGTLSSLINQTGRAGGRSANITRGSAVSLPFRTSSMTAVVTDPPYDEMIPYTDASDLSFVWLKRALCSTQPWFAFTTDPDGVQEKSEEIIVKKFRARKTAKDHRTRSFYDSMIARAFAEARRVVEDDGVVTIVFGHGDPEVWHRLLGAITEGGLVLTGSWPAKTESDKSGGSANIVTTLTMSCRPAPQDRQPGRASLVEAEVRREVQARVPMWEAAGLAPTDQLMASAGPAMEVVGRYSQVLDNLGEPVEPDRYLLVARRAVQEVANIEIDHLPLETFDARTRFALSWVRLYGRGLAPKSEARWQALASDLELEDLKGVLFEMAKGVALSTSDQLDRPITENSSVIDVAMAMARAWQEGLDVVGEVLAASQRSLDDPYLWAAMGFLSSKLPEADLDAVAWTGLVRAKRGIGAATREVVTNKKRADEDADSRLRQGNLFEQLDLKVEGQLDLTDEGEGK
jgi:putative DNA methylase